MSKENKKCCHYHVCKYVNTAHQYGEECSCNTCIHNSHSYVSDDLMEQVERKKMSCVTRKAEYVEGFNDCLLKVQSILSSHRGERK